MGVLVAVVFLVAFYFGFQDKSKFIFIKNNIPLKGLDKYYNSVRNSLIKKQIKQTKDPKVKSELKRALRVKRISLGLMFFGISLIIMSVVMSSTR